MFSLDRLIDLAKQTGDSLIVHDPIEGRDIVIMEVDEYEKLVLNKKEQQVLGDDYGDDWRGQPEDWSSAGSVLDDRYGGRFGNEWDEDIEDNKDEEIKDSAQGGPASGWDIPDFEPLENLDNEKKEEPRNVPYQNFLGETEWKEEPLLEEEPVFYEEPV